MPRAMKDLTGNKYNEWTVISFNSANRSGHYYWNCECSCGKRDSVNYSHLVYGKSKSCGCKKPTLNRKVNWTGCECGRISGNMIDQIKRSANGSKGKRKPIDYNLDPEYLCGLFTGKCALTKVDIHFSDKSKRSTTASLDRIDSRFGYIKGNVQWVHKDINKMKNSFDQGYFIYLCKLVAGGACEVK